MHKHQQGWLEQPTRYSFERAVPGYWPPCQSRFWSTVLEPLRSRLGRRRYCISRVHVAQSGSLESIGPGDGVLVASNHSHEADAYVLYEAARQLGRRFYFMAAQEAFAGHHGIDGWILQRLGAFSVDRQGCDRRSLHQAIDLLIAGQWLAVFPEGEIYHLNERLKPLLDGVAFITLSAQQRLEESGSSTQVWLLPAAIRYRFVEDVRPRLEQSMTLLENRVFWWKPPRRAALADRIMRLGEAVLTLKEKEKLGRSRESEGTLPQRIAFLAEALLSRHESEYGLKVADTAAVPLRVKALRRRLLDAWSGEQAHEQARDIAREALDDVQLVLQLYSYPGDYIAEDPTPERMAETVEKFEEDVYGSSRPLGWREATMLFSEPIQIKQEGGTRRRRESVAEVTETLEHAILERMAELRAKSASSAEHLGRSVGDAAATQRPSAGEGRH